MEQSFDLGWLLGMSKNPVTLGLLIFGMVQTVKRQAEAHKPPIIWNPWLWRSIAAGFGLATAALLHLWTGEAQLGAVGWPGVLIFGLVAALCAVAGRDGLKTVLEWVSGAKQVTQTTTQASTPDGASVATTTTTAPAGALPEPPTGLEGPPPEAFDQPTKLLSLARLPDADVDGQPLTHPAFSMRE